MTPFFGKGGIGLSSGLVRAFILGITRLRSFKTKLRRLDVKKKKGRTDRLGTNPLRKL